MRVRRFVIVTVTIAALALAGCRGTSSANDLVSIGSGLSGPAGTKATVYARGLKNVAALAFDSQGRLWAATALYGDKGIDHIAVISRAGATPKTVISSLHTPLGLLWYHGALYVASKRTVVVYKGFDGTTFASHQTIVTLPAAVGEVNELVLSPTGRMLLGVSAACDHCVVTEKYSAAILSFEPDGSDLQVYAKRIRAAVGLAYYPKTSNLLVTMNQRDDLGDKTPGDWLAVVREGSDWRFPSCYGQSGSVCAGVPKPTAVLDKHSAASGVAIVTGQLGATIGTAALVAEWTDGKVVRVALSRSVSSKSVLSSSTGAAHPFITGLKNPVPVILGPHDTVLIGDWGRGIVYSISRA